MQKVLFSNTFSFLHMDHITKTHLQVGMQLFEIGILYPSKDFSARLILVANMFSYLKSTNFVSIWYWLWVRKIQQNILYFEERNVVPIVIMFVKRVICVAKAKYVYIHAEVVAFEAV